MKQTLDGETIYSVYGLDGTLYFRDNITTGETTDYVRMGSHTVGRMDAAGAFTWTHSDHLGSVAVATDAAGALVFWESHTPFGEPLQDPAANRDEAGFTGHIRDAATGLTYAQARYYNPVIARFYAPDPVGFAGGGPGYFNRYAYTMNDPVNMTDPTGMWIETAWDAFNVGLGVSSLISNARQGNWGAAAVDAGGVLVDTAATIVPIVPAGAGVAIQASRTGSDIIQGTAQVTRRGGIETPHAATSQRHADQMAASGEYSSVHMNQALSTITEGAVSSRARPDVAGVTKDTGQVDVIEARSPRQDEDALSQKYSGALGDRAGVVQCVDQDSC